MRRRRHDFVVVETIDFYADEDAELPPPMSQRDVVALNNAAGMEEEEAPADAAAEGASGQARDAVHVPLLLHFCFLYVLLVRLLLSKTECMYWEAFAPAL